MTDFQIVEVLKERATHDANNEFGLWIGRLLTAWVTDSPLADIDNILSERLRAEVSSPARLPFKCKARASAVDPPQDCDWPRCGCDLYADKVIEAIEESGFQIVKAAEVSSPQQERAALVVRIEKYLCNGGLFNPESMEHLAVQDLLLDIRTYLATKEVS